MHLYKTAISRHDGGNGLATVGEDKADVAVFLALISAWDKQQFNNATRYQAVRYAVCN
ncbi:hypothetical protein PAMC26577_05445 [Caballeronia sordidicola]|uniref:Uncharacterized protein n=1 Tax=Caballeronia sordidicola TaxID=196367 RepID=A0A242N3Y3_CABSO|nr:hypothetical protein PAMC26577_05445 [Caballeronia sordidicola]